jgi:type I restriction enzyme R subunit
MKQFSEATRVQMPAMVHLTRIGYTYFGKIRMAQSMTVTQIFCYQFLSNSSKD